MDNLVDLFLDPPPRCKDCEVVMDWGQQYHPAIGQRVDAYTCPECGRSVVAEDTRFHDPPG